MQNPKMYVVEQYATIKFHAMKSFLILSQKYFIIFILWNLFQRKLFNRTKEYLFFRIGSLTKSVMLETGCFNFLSHLVLYLLHVLIHKTD